MGTTELKVGKIKPFKQRGIAPEVIGIFAVTVLAITVLAVTTK